MDAQEKTAPVPAATATRVPTIELLPPREDIDQEHALATRAEVSIVERLLQQGIKEGTELFAQRARLLEACYKEAIKRTRPQDWVLFKDKDDNTLAMLKASGATIVGELYGIEVTQIIPTASDGSFNPVRVDHGNGAYGYQAWISGWSRFSGRNMTSLPAEIRSDEDFTGRSVDADNRMVKKRPEDGAALDADLKASLFTRLNTKLVRVLCNMVRVPGPYLAACGIDLGQASRGSGYGSATERGAQKVAETGAVQSAAQLWAECMKAAGGDADAASDILADITAFDKKDGSGRFPGYRDHKRITSIKMVEIATHKLHEHPMYTGREPGEGE